MLFVCQLHEDTLGNMIKNNNSIISPFYQIKMHEN